MNAVPGFVSLVGAGPGDPELLTLRGLKRLQQAQVVLRDALLDEGFAQLWNPQAEVLYVGKRCGDHALRQERINDLLVEKAREGKRVVRLKGGDPLLFGRGAEEALALAQAGIEFEIVPGVSALNGAAGPLGLPLTHRGLSDQILVTHAAGFLERGELPPSWSAAFRGTLVLFMGASRLREVAGKLLDLGVSPDLPLALVENAGLPGETLQLGSLADALGGVLERSGLGPGLIYAGPSLLALRSVGAQNSAIGAQGLASQRETRT